MTPTGNRRHFSISGLLAFSDDPEPLKCDHDEPKAPQEPFNDHAKNLTPPKYRVCLHFLIVSKKNVKKYVKPKIDRILLFFGKIFLEITMFNLYFRLLH